MTICVGIVANGGLVVAADYQETVGEAKTPQGKFCVASVSKKKIRGACAITGAGTAAYLDAFGALARDAFLDCKLLPAIAVQNQLETVLHAFHVEHVHPFKDYPDHDRPSIEVLIGYQWNLESRLLITSKTTVRRAESYAAVGAGSTVASTLLRRYYRANITIEEAVNLAIHMVDEAKRSALYCGLETDVWVIRRNMVDRVDSDYVEMIERALRRYHRLEAEVYRSTMWPRHENVRLLQQKIATLRQVIHASDYRSTLTRVKRPGRPRPTHDRTGQPPSRG